MKITEREIPVTSTVSVFDGVIRREHCGCEGRTCDGFVFVLSGSAEYTFAQKRFTAEAGNVFYLACGDTYSIHVTGHPYRFICADFRFAPQETAPESELYRLRGEKAMENTFVKLLNLWRLGDFSDKLRCRALLYEIYAAIVKADAMEELSPDRTEKMAAVVQYIQEHYAEPDLSVEQLAELYGTSSVHFRRAFARLYRTSPIKFLTALRLSHARELLLNTDLPVGQICVQCGYTSVYYFDRVFKREFGTQPLRLRSQSL